MSSALLLVLVSAPCVTSRVFDDTASFYTPNRPLWTGRPMFSFPPAAAAGGATGGGVPTAIVSGASVDVWGAVNTLHRCGSYIASVPDIPARAYDDNDGVTHMIVGSTSYHHMNGSSILNVGLLLLPLLFIPIQPCTLPIRDEAQLCASRFKPFLLPSRRLNVLLSRATRQLFLRVQQVTRECALNVLLSRATIYSFVCNR